MFASSIDGNLHDSQITMGFNANHEIVNQPANIDRFVAQYGNCRIHMTEGTCT